MSSRSASASAPASASVSASFVESVSASAAASAACPMSRTPSVGTADLGRLALTGQGSSSGSGDMPATTRGAARKEAAAPKQSSLQSAPKTERGKQKASASSAKPSRQQPRRLSKTTSGQRPKPGHDDDDSDDSDDADDDDDDDEEGGGGGPSAAQDPRQAIYRRVLEIDLPFEPSQHSLGELAASNLPGRSAASALFRASRIAFASLVRSQADMNLLTQAVPVQGRQWSLAMVAQMRLRWKKINERWYNYTRGTGGEDVDSTIAQIKALFTAIEDTIRSFPNMSNGSHLALIEILVEVMEMLQLYYQDTRPAGGIAYAGGASQYEHILWLRFATLDSNWQPCLEVMRRLGQGNCSAHFRHYETRWNNIWMSYRSLHASWKADEVRHFMFGFRDRLAGMRVPGFAVPTE